jgi:hypothetical protein
MSHQSMKRRDLLAAMTGGAVLAASNVKAATSQAPPCLLSSSLPTGAEDRSYMLELLGRMASPVLDRMSRGRLQREWTPELSPTWDGRNPKVAYLEAFGRLVDGIAPWLALPEEPGSEGRMRATLRTQALESYVHAVDPKSPDYLLWKSEGQPLVDSAYFTSAFLRAPEVLWKPLDARTKARIIAEIQGLRRVAPPYTNWLLFAAINEAFLLSVGAQWDPIRVDLAVRKFNEWYVGDGWYADGVRFHFDLYNSYVIHPMLTQILEVLVATDASFNNLKQRELLPRQYQRMQRYGEELERMIGARWRLRGNRPLADVSHCRAPAAGPACMAQETDGQAARGPGASGDGRDTTTGICQCQQLRRGRFPDHRLHASSAIARRYLFQCRQHVHCIREPDRARSAGAGPERSASALDHAPCVFRPGFPQGLLR